MAVVTKPSDRTSAWAVLGALLFIAAFCFPATAQETQPRERVHADVSTRSVRVTSSFTGTEIIVFGAIGNSRPEKPDEDDLYDVVVVLEGLGQKLVARRKSRVAGIWINTDSLAFKSVPSYYAISSTRPLFEIAKAEVLRDHAIGFEHIRMVPDDDTNEVLSLKEISEYGKAVVRLKEKDGLYVQNEYGVSFIGQGTLFRTTIDLPANVPVGPLKTRVVLFRQGKRLSEFTSEVTMQRGGIERFMHTFAFGYPFFYGVAAVIIAAGAGLAASTYFNRSRA